MHYYKATIQYDGTDYSGFQWQKDIPSIQNDFNEAIKSLVDGKVTTMGTSRTDTGVHAMEQVVKVTSEHPIEHPSLLSEFNKRLPPQIRCLDFVSCPKEFRPASSPISKEYRYYFTNKRNVENDNGRFISNTPYKLNIDAMKLCLSEIVGIHDFQNFCSAGSNVKTTRRKITICELTEINPQSLFLGSDIFKIPPELESCYQLRIEGDGFLKQMIRHIVRGAWMVGSGKLTPEDFSNILNGPKREQRIWKVAPAQGLFLYKINYQN